MNDTISDANLSAFTLSSTTARLALTSVGA